MVRFDDISSGNKVIIAFSFCSANSKSDKDGIVHFNVLNFINLKFET